MQTRWFPAKARYLFAGILNLFYSIGNFVCQGMMKRHNMGVSNTKIVVPRANDENFGFAFNDSDFSDRILHLEIVSDNDHSKDSESCNGAKVVTLHISSLILAAKSPFFYKLFKNGMRESQYKNDVSLRIDASEETAFMDLLDFMYENTLSATFAPDLVDVLIVADKFEVTSCMRYCIEMLLKIPMSLEFAILYLELPSSVLISEIVKPLVDATKEYLVGRYKDFTKSQEEALELPLSAIEVVLESKDLQVASEDDVFDFMLNWARTHYTELEDRREILTKRLARVIFFPNMSCSKLKEVLVCPDFEHEQVSKLVMEAVFSKLELSCGQHIHTLNVSKDLATTTNCNFLGCVYRPHCVVVYFDLKKDELKSLSPSIQLDSQPFCVGGKQLYLWAKRWMDEYRDSLCLFVQRVQGSKTSTLDVELGVVRNKLSKEFQIKCKGKGYRFENLAKGRKDLLGITWTELMSDDNEYFIDGVLRLQARITVVDQ